MIHEPRLNRALKRNLRKRGLEHQRPIIGNTHQAHILQSPDGRVPMPFGISHGPAAACISLARICHIPWVSQRTASPLPI